MPIPTTYSDWVIVLERFGNGDDTLFDEMNSGSFVLDAGSAKRFYLRVEESYKKRKQSWLEKFQRSFQIQNIKTEDEFGLMLRNGKQNLVPLVKFVTSKGLPEDLRKTLQKDLKEFISEIKKSLEDNASKKSKIRDKMLVMLNTFGIPGILEEEKNDINSRNIKAENNSIQQTGRKIIF